jgi:hypothetical protein
VKIKGGNTIISDIKKVETSFSVLLGELNKTNSEIAFKIEQQPLGKRLKLMDNKRDYRAKIRRLLQIRVPSELGRLRKAIEAIVTDIDALKRTLRDDWAADAVVLWKECEPHKKRECIG